MKHGIVLGCTTNKRTEIDKAKTDLIAKFLPPKLIKGIRSFLGHVGFYQRFIKDFTKIARFLTNLHVKNVPFKLTLECLKTFELLKKELTLTPIIHASNWSKYLSSCVMHLIILQF